MVWTEERIAQLVRLWNDGLTTGEIGKQLEVSKNAVVGKAHRLGLTSRPSPIKRSKVEKAEDTRIRSVVELSALTCRWPIGDPRDANFHFCGKRVMTGKPYCPDHAAVAYVNSSKSRKDDAA
ncbi:MAG: GcrA family cell cycle regulator [Alphaproteobacteria bacterium]